MTVKDFISKRPFKLIMQIKIDKRPRFMNAAGHFITFLSAG